MSDIEVYELPVDASLEGFCRTYEVNVPTERGEMCVVNVDHLLQRDTYTVEFSGAIFDQAPQAVTATVQLVMLTIADQRRDAARIGGPTDA